jgi:sugar (pentulose or hexulose) kinase
MLGAAIAAVVGAGWHSSFQEAANVMIRIRKKIKPDVNRYRKYQEFFPIYRRLYSCLKSITAQGIS